MEETVKSDDSIAAALLYDYIELKCVEYQTRLKTWSVNNKLLDLYRSFLSSILHQRCIAHTNIFLYSFAVISSFIRNHSISHAVLTMVPAPSRSRTAIAMRGWYLLIMHEWTSERAGRAVCPAARQPNDQQHLSSDWRVCDLLLLIFLGWCYGDTALEEKSMLINVYLTRVAQEEWFPMHIALTGRRCISCVMLREDSCRIIFAFFFSSFHWRCASQTLNAPWRP